MLVKQQKSRKGLSNKDQLLNYFLTSVEGEEVSALPFLAGYLSEIMDQKDFIEALDATRIYVRGIQTHRGRKK